MVRSGNPLDFHDVMVDLSESFLIFVNCALQISRPLQDSASFLPLFLTKIGQHYSNFDNFILKLGKCSQSSIFVEIFRTEHFVSLLTIRYWLEKIGRKYAQKIKQTRKFKNHIFLTVLRLIFCPVKSCLSYLLLVQIESHCCNLSRKRQKKVKNQKES